MRRPTAIFVVAILSGMLAACDAKEARDEKAAEVSTVAVPTTDPVPQPVAADKKAVTPDVGDPAAVPARSPEKVTGRDNAKPAKPVRKTETTAKAPAARETAAPAEPAADPHAGHDMKGTQPRLKQAITPPRRQR